MKPHTLLEWLTASALFAMAGLANAQPADTLPATHEGRFEFRSGPTLVLEATLTLPRGDGPFPAVVVMHGGTGIEPVEAADVADLTARGYAVAVIDSFKGRGFRAGASGGAGATILPSARVPDAYDALRVLATHPRLDASRIALFGRSHGGTATIVASTAAVRQRYAVAGTAFKAFFALYPGCSTRYPELDQLSAPLRIHVGASDDLTPAAACEAIVERMRSLGQDAALTRYDGGHHAFEQNIAVTYHPQWTSFAACTFRPASVDAPVDMAQIRQCVSRGATIGGNPSAAVLWRNTWARELDTLVR